ncbi:MAG: AmmeMemoRadiSam system protein B [Campylobacterales bacterium]|nr:AmmeMemoRadiSam system protein B [Campylobacterales bacterium]
MNSRKLAVNGQFYPNNSYELERFFHHLDSNISNNLEKQQSKNNRAIIVPHAGYIYSGYTANIAYRMVPKEIQTIIVIGPSHKYRFEGASIAQYNSYPTPIGSLDIDTKLSLELEQEFDFLNFYNQVHCEHSTETQFPFIKHYSGDKKAIEIIYSQIEYKDLSHLIDYLLQDKNNFVVISTDLSHFYTIEEANKLDSICIEGIKNKNIQQLDHGCEACGIIGVKALINAILDQNYSINILDYRTSANTSGDTQRVVGYLSAVVSQQS